jgi:hypothetical protein
MDMADSAWASFGHVTTSICQTDKPTRIRIRITERISKTKAAGRNTMALVLVQLMAIGGAPANPQLAGVNNGWIGVLGLFCDVNRDSHGNPGSWLPPHVSRTISCIHSSLDDHSLHERVRGSSSGTQTHKSPRCTPTHQPHNSHSLIRTVALVHVPNPQKYHITVFTEALEACPVYRLHVCTMLHDQLSHRNAVMTRPHG